MLPDFPEESFLKMCLDLHVVKCQRLAAVFLGLICAVSGLNGVWLESCHPAPSSSLPFDGELDTSGGSRIGERVFAAVTIEDTGDHRLVEAVVIVAQQMGESFIPGVDQINSNDMVFVGAGATVEAELSVPRKDLHFFKRDMNDVLKTILHGPCAQETTTEFELKTNNNITIS